MEEIRDSVRIEHSGRLLSGLLDLKQDNFLSDFTIEAGGRHFLVHRTVIAAASSYFKGMFSSKMREVAQRSVVMQDITPHAIEQCILFMYSGEAIIDMDNVEDIVFASALLNLEGMMKLCASYLEQELCFENCIFVKEIADRYSWKDLKAIADRHIADNFEVLVERDDFVASLPFSELLHYLVFLKTKNEVRWSATLKWLQLSEFSDEDRCVQLAQLTDLSQFSFPFILHTIQESPGVLEHEHVKQFVLQLLFFDKEKLEKGINLNNCFTLLSLVEDAMHSEAKELIINFMMGNCDNVTLRNEFKELDLQTVQLILASDETNLTSEISRVKGVIRWVKHRTERKGYFPQLFSLVDLGQLPHNYLTNTFPKEPLLTEFPECKRQVDNFLTAGTYDRKQFYQTEVDKDEAVEKLETIGAQGGEIAVKGAVVRIPENAFLHPASVKVVVHHRIHEISSDLIPPFWNFVSCVLDFKTLEDLKKPAKAILKIRGGGFFWLFHGRMTLQVLYRTWDNRWRKLEGVEYMGSSVKVTLPHSCCVVAATPSKSSKRDSRLLLDWNIGGNEDEYLLDIPGAVRMKSNHREGMDRLYAIFNQATVIKTKKASFIEDIKSFMKVKATKTKMVGVAGGTIELFGCKITFPEDAIKEEESITLSVDNNPDNYPEHLHCITPILGFKPSRTFEKLVDVEMDTWFGPANGETISAILFSRKSNSEWKKIGEVQLDRSNKIRFSVSHFCEIIVSVKPQDHLKGEYTVSNSVYIQQGTCTIHSSFYLDAKTEHDVWEAMRRRSLATFSTRQLRVVGTENEEIQVQGSITKPKEKTIEDIVPSNKFPIAKVTKFKIHDLQLDPELDSLLDEYDGSVKGKYSIGIQGKERDVAILARKWPVSLDPEDKSPKQNFYGNAISTGNSNLTQTMQDTKSTIVSNTKG